MESEAVIGILKRCDNREWELVGNDIIKLEILTKELGPLGMALFMRQYDRGYGYYTEERNELLKDITIEDIEQELGAMQ